MSLLSFPFSCCWYSGEAEPFTKEMAAFEERWKEENSMAVFQSPDSFTMARVEANAQGYDPRAILKPLAPNVHQIATSKYSNRSAELATER